jgi:hypothetical protein
MPLLMLLGVSHTFEVTRLNSRTDTSCARQGCRNDVTSCHKHLAPAADPEHCALERRAHALPLILTCAICAASDNHALA